MLPMLAWGWNFFRWRYFMASMRMCDVFTWDGVMSISVCDTHQTHSHRVRAFWKIYWLWLHRMHHLHSYIKHGVWIWMRTNSMKSSRMPALICKPKLIFFNSSPCGRTKMAVEGDWVIRDERRCLLASEKNNDITIRIVYRFLMFVAVVH